MLTCSGRAHEAPDAPEEHEEPQCTVEAFQSHHVHDGGDVHGHHAAKQEAVERRRSHDGPVGMAGGQQEEHHTLQRHHGGQQLQVPDQPQVGHPAADQPAHQVGHGQRRQDHSWPVVAKAEAAGEGRQEERWDEESRRRKDGKQDVEEHLGFPQQLEVHLGLTLLLGLCRRHGQAFGVCRQWPHEGAAHAQVELEASDDEQGTAPPVRLDQPLEEGAEEEGEDALARKGHGEGHGAPADKVAAHHAVSWDPGEGDAQSCREEREAFFPSFFYSISLFVPFVILHCTSDNTIQNINVHGQKELLRRKKLVLPAFC